MRAPHADVPPEQREGKAAAGDGAAGVPDALKPPQPGATKTTLCRFGGAAGVSTRERPGTNAEPPGSSAERADAA